MDSFPFKVEVVKRKRQKNLRLRVKGSDVFVSAPVYCSSSEIEQFISGNLKWIENALSKQKANKEALHETLQKHKRAILVEGKWLPLIFSGAHSDPNGISFRRQGDVIAWFADKSSSFYVDFPLIKKAANSWLKERAKSELRLRIEQLAAKNSFEFQKIFIRSQKTKWGTCSSKQNISLNWRLMKVPDWVRDYLIIHELCHTVHLNHSKDYWNLVEQHYPERKQAEAWLKKNEAIVFADSETL